MRAVPKVSIIVPTLSRRDNVLLPSLQSLLDQTHDNFEIIVVDQNDRLSSGLLRFVGEHDTILRHVHISEKGLPNARNVGLAHARGEIILYVDDDIVASPGLVAAHARNYGDPKIGGVAGRVIQRRMEFRISEGGFRRRQSRCRILALGFGLLSSFIRGPQSGVRDPKPGIRNPKNSPVGRFRWWDANFTGNYDATVRVEIDAVYGCNMSFRREVLSRVGGFSKAFGGTAHLEETDVSLAIKKIGYRLVFDPEAVLEHVYIPTGGCRMNHEGLAYWYAHNYVLLFLRRFKRISMPVFLAERIARVLLWGGEQRSLAVAVSGLRGLRDGFETYRRLPSERRTRGDFGPGLVF